MKRMILVYCLCLAATSAYAEGVEGNWIADAKTGCKVWNHFSIPDQSITWLGECKNGKTNGKGTLRRYAGKKIIFIFEGVMKDGKAHGDGTLTCLPTGYKYSGGWSEDKENGKGELVSADGTSYIGTFRNGKFDGKGTVIYQNGDKYSGGWSEGKEHGKGTYTFKDGTSYEGLWEHGERIKIF